MGLNKGDSAAGKTSSAMTSAEVRAELMDTLRLDLIGPRDEDENHRQYVGEVLPSAPSKYYLTGFLVPFEAPFAERSDENADESLEEQAAEGPKGDDNVLPEAASARKAGFPSSMGLSFLVSAGIPAITAQITWGDYAPEAASRPELDPNFASDAELAQAEANQAGPEPGDAEGEADSESGEREAGSSPGGKDEDPSFWRRFARSATLEISLARLGELPALPTPDSGGLQLSVSVREVQQSEHLGAIVPAGTRAVSVFLVNRRLAMIGPERDRAYAFQPELALHCSRGFAPRPNMRGKRSDDWDEQVADLQYSDCVEYAVGHNVSAKACMEGNLCTRVVTSWLPQAQVEKVSPAAIADVELRMPELAKDMPARELQAKLMPLVSQYEQWQAQQPSPEDPARAEVAARLLANARRANGRIKEGIECLADPVAHEAFRIANRVIATAMVKRLQHSDKSKTEPYPWRPFQLAFILMNMPGVVDENHADREVVDLLFFPTGGGKTEAYLGLAAFTLALRRLRDPTIQSAGLTVIMRYTLRLLTLDQLDRASTLICALELERQKAPERLGEWPFEIGLWVGQSATPNRMGKKGDSNKHTAHRKTLDFRNDSKGNGAPIPIENCPWCGSKLHPKSFDLLPDTSLPSQLRIRCRNRRCDYNVHKQPNGLPIIAVDEMIYRRLPAFMIATVDKFANLPWVGESGALFGRVNAYHPKEGFYGPCDPAQGRALLRPLPPPALIIQDELHLISGPLGTMVGLYETAIDALCRPDIHSKGGRPKIVASTATVRRADKQVRALFARPRVEVFPPPGPDRRDSFFAKTDDVSLSEPRTYLGVAAQGRSLKVVLLRSYVALLAAAHKIWLQHGGDKAENNPADPYMTLLGYFNSLRELGGSRRIVEDEVRSRLSDYRQRRMRITEAPALFSNRKRFRDPRELTSRVSTDRIAETKARLANRFDGEQAKASLDVALATNMISVGLDITRLGLMVVLGQPKTAAEYIQATSRVGRDVKRPGLVISLLNIHRHRDRSYYERFGAWHASFYRAVEATSVTPFSPRAIDRGLSAVCVALARLGHEQMTPARGAGKIRKHREALDFVHRIISERVQAYDNQQGERTAQQLADAVEQRTRDVLASWEQVAEYLEGQLQYQREEGAAQRLIYEPLHPDGQAEDKQLFRMGRSLRDVEPTVQLRLREVKPGMHKREDGS